MFALFLSTSDAGLSLVGFAMLCGIGLSVLAYFLPTFVAVRRKHGNVSSIALTNFFFGWTFVGWVVALVWAFSDNAKAV
jgi:hypothetical protein